MLILGFGREGKSVYKYFRRQNADNHIIIADINPNVIEDECLIGDKNIDFILGNDYLDKIFNTQSFENELIIKSPGISLKNHLENYFSHKTASSTKTDLPLSTTHNHFQFKITSPTDIFLQKYAQQTIGITGTKGKSTTSSLIYHIIKKQTDNVLLVGNIGKPALDYVEQINAETIIVFELSSHQLEFLQKAPHISILLNIFEEHLDHYNSYQNYQKAKWNIAAKQGKDDFFIVNEDDELLRVWLLKSPPKSKVLKFGDSAQMKVCNAYNYGKSEFLSFLQGKHNLYNINAAAIACKIIGISPENVVAGIADFEPLPHRLQFVGEFNEIKFYNDSISTIPQATIAALQAIPKVQTLVLGGFDRGIDYTVLTDYLVENPVENIILIGEAGKRIRHIWVKMLIENPKHKKLNINFFDADNYNDVVDIAKRHTSKRKAVLLSPAAASYDMFKNFEHRGDVFMELVKKSVTL